MRISNKHLHLKGVNKVFQKACPIIKYTAARLVQDPVNLLPVLDNTLMNAALLITNRRERISIAVIVENIDIFEKYVNSLLPKERRELHFNALVNKVITALREKNSFSEGDRGKTISYIHRLRLNVLENIRKRFSQDENGMYHDSESQSKKGLYPFQIERALMDTLARYGFGVNLSEMRSLLDFLKSQIPTIKSSDKNTPG
ncbi:MAG: hypothetical protein QNJ31_06420 [Candidatus Caenarcaniphilales bacterium]|nr:hypothetical protein [Candidatus Caenarcaniphilales bacterium]